MFNIVRIAAGATLLCAGHAGAMAPAGSGTLEFPEETAAIVEATASLFDQIEAQAQDPAPETPVIGSPRLATQVSLSASDARAEFTTDRGPVAHLTGYRINWYPVDRMVGAVDFMGTWNDNRDLVSGFLLWDLTDPDLPTLDSIVVNYIDVGKLASGTPGEAHMALLDANCAYGEIDANFTVFAEGN